jgi:hypothetical protein
MNRLLLTAAMLCGVIITTAQTADQEDGANEQRDYWSKGSRNINIGVGFNAPFLHHGWLSWQDGSQFGEESSKWSTVSSAQLNTEIEYGVHDNIGVGFLLGIGGGGGNSALSNAGYFYMITGIFSNYHFSKLLSLNKKLDLYAGVNFGVGLALVKVPEKIYPYGSIRIEQTQGGPMVFGGFQVGVNYFITDKIGLSAQVGFGKSVVSLGVVFRR